MRTFKTWLTEHTLTRDQNSQIQKLYDSIIRLLLGSARDQTHLSLSDIEDDSAANGKPPTQKGAMVALNKLNSAQIFQKIEQMGDMELTRKAHETQNWLNKVAQDQNVGPKDTVGELMNRLFGAGAVETYGDRTWVGKAQVQPQVPRNNNPPQQMQPPQDPNQAAPQPQQPVPDPNMQPDPNMTPDMQGTGPLQSPGGPMPPKPPMQF